MGPGPMGRWLFGWVALALFLTSGAVRAAPSDLDALLEDLRQLPGLSARFREEKQIRILSMPLVNEGVIHFAPPSELLRVTERPVRRMLHLDGDALVLFEGKKRTRVSFGTHPAVGVLAGIFVHLLRGDREGLERDFEVHLFQDEASAGWRLALSPRDPKVRAMVEGIDVAGEGTRISDLVVRETSGDVSHTTFSEVDLTGKAGAEIRRLLRDR